MENNSNKCPVCGSTHIQLVLVRSRVVPIDENLKIVAPICNVFGNLCLDCGSVFGMKVIQSELKKVTRKLNY